MSECEMWKMCDFLTPLIEQHSKKEMVKLLWKHKNRKNPHFANTLKKWSTRNTNMEDTKHLEHTT